MKHQELFLTAAIAASVALSAPVVNAGQVNSAEARAFEAAQESPSALRHFVHRTRMIYALNFRDYYTPGAEGPDADITTEADGYASSGQSTEAEAAPQSGAVPSAKRQKELEEFREQIYRDMQHE